MILIAAEAERQQEENNNSRHKGNGGYKNLMPALVNPANAIVIARYIYYSIKK